MSIRVMTQVWEIDLPASQKIVMLALADCANDEGRAWPSLATLALKCSKSERTVRSTLGELEAMGHITRHQIIGKGCKYVVHPCKNSTPANSAPRQISPHTPANSAGIPRQISPHTPANSAPNPSMNRQVNRQRNGRTARTSFAAVEARPPVVPYTIEIENILAEADARPDRKHWRAALDALMVEKGASVRHPNAMRRKILLGWLAGDGTPLPDSPPSRRLTASEQRAAEINAKVAAEYDSFLEQLDAATLTPPPLQIAQGGSL